MSPTAALALVCLGLITLWPLIALTNYVATTWRYGLNERARLRRVAEENLRLDALIRAGMRRLEIERVKEREEAMRAALSERKVLPWRKRSN